MAATLIAKRTALYQSMITNLRLPNMLGKKGKILGDS